MIEQFFDEPILKVKGFEFDLTEVEDLQIWFETEQPSMDSLSAREGAIYEYLKEKGVL